MLGDVMHAGWMPSRKAGFAAVLVMLSVVITPSVGGRPVAANVGEAKSIIAEHCIECHRVPGFAEGKGSPTVEAPDFQTIADDPKTYTNERMQAFLRNPHFPMRALILSESDIQNLIGFIQGLKKSGSGAN